MIDIDAGSTVPPYEQIRSQYARLIGGGGLAAGTKLPTVRQLAADLGLAVNTVARAYRELEAGGLIETCGRAGTVVSAQGDRVRERALVAAQDYARRVSALGLTSTEALGIVRAVLGS